MSHSESENSYFYKDHPQSCAADDFWGQVKRTVNGEPISQEQIDLIVESVCTGLQLSSDDYLLDLCCGNGALTTLLVNQCQRGLAVDISEYLINVAKKNFERLPAERYLLSDVLAFVKDTPLAQEFTKLVCYGSFQYLPKDVARQLLESLRMRFNNLQRIFIGNVPDKARLMEFYQDRDYQPGIEESVSSPIGIWRTQDEFRALAETCGWQASFYVMPDAYYASHYRYDVVLVPQ